MIVDCHQHVFWRGCGDADLVADMDAAGIDVAWLLTWEIPPAEHDDSYPRDLNPLNVRPDGTHAGITLADVVLARDRYPGRFVLGYCPDPRLSVAAELFEAACEMYRVRVCGEWKFRMLLDDPRCLELFRAAGRRGCPVVVHVDVPYRPDEKTRETAYQPLWYGGTIDNLARAMSACRETIFIGHAPGFWREISGDASTQPALYPKGPIVPGGRLPALFDDHPNLRADLSAPSALWALRRDRAHAETFLTRFADRLLFGRDACTAHLHELLESLDLTDDVREKILFRNARELVGCADDQAPPAH